jgi:NADPH:quinone reductase-like Zn-dependent oxidoreductase
MRAIVWTRYGPPDRLQLREVERPVPKDNEVLIRVEAATVTAGDCEVGRLDFSFFLALIMRFYIGVVRPRRVTVLGQELAGEVEAVGKEVKRFKAGDQVFALCGFHFGNYAEYNCLPEEIDDGAMVKKPANMTFEEAAAVPLGGLESLHFLREGNIGSGQEVLIIGAGGSIGTSGIQLAKHFGAEVTAVDSTPKLEMMRSIGADHVVDYTKEDFTKGGKTYDVIFDVVGKSSVSRNMGSLRDGGYYLLANPSMKQMLRGRSSSKKGNKNFVAGTTSYKDEDLIFLRELIEAGKFKTVIDRVYPLEQTAEAHRYVEKGGKLGNVVISVAPDTT